MASRSFSQSRVGPRRVVTVRSVTEHTGSVAAITGAARGQGRSHAVALAAEGADIIAIDRCADIDSIPYPLGTKVDLDETVAAIESLGRRVVPVIADVRDLDALNAGVRSGIAQLGEIDIVIANAGVVAIGKTDPLDTQLYRDIVETNLNGVWHTIVATVPSIIRKGRGGSIVLTSSAQGLVGRGGDGSAAMFAYAAVWQASVQLGIATWWVGPRSQPTPAVVGCATIIRDDQKSRTGQPAGFLRRCSSSHRNSRDRPTEVRRSPLCSKRDRTQSPRRC